MSHKSEENKNNSAKASFPSKKGDKPEESLPKSSFKVEESITFSEKTEKISKENSSVRKSKDSTPMIMRYPKKLSTSFEQPILEFPEIFEFTQTGNQFVVKAEVFFKNDTSCLNTIQEDERVSSESELQNFLLVGSPENGSKKIKLSKSKNFISCVNASPVSPHRLESDFKRKVKSISKKQNCNLKLAPKESNWSAFSWSAGGKSQSSDDIIQYTEGINMEDNPKLEDEIEFDLKNIKVELGTRSERKFGPSIVRIHRENKQIIVQNKEKYVKFSFSDLKLVEDFTTAFRMLQFKQEDKGFKQIKLTPIDSEKFIQEIKKLSIN